LRLVDSAEYLPSWKFMPDVVPAFADDSELRRVINFEDFSNDSWTRGFLRRGHIAAYASQGEQLDRLFRRETTMEQWRLLNFIAEYHPGLFWERYHRIKKRIPAHRI